MNHLFKENKYTRWYYSIVDRILSMKRIKTDGLYLERHHIIPKSLDSTLARNKNNLVLVTPREHLILHKLLVRMVISTDHRYKMLEAIRKYAYRHKLTHLVVRDIEEARKLQSERLKMWWKNASTGERKARLTMAGWNKGKPLSEEQKKTISIQRKGKYTGKDNAFYGKTHTVEARLKMSKVHKGKIPWNKGLKLSSNAR